MLLHYNAKINVSRFVEVDGIRTRSIVKSDYDVYINPRGEDIVEQDSGQGAYKQFMMMTSGDYLIIEGDKIIWSSRNFVCKGGANYSDLTGTHGQYILMEVYD